MPELPDLEAYVGALSARVAGRVLRRAQVRNPFVLRSVEPPLAALEARPVQSVRRQAKRIVFAFPDALFLVVHLMIAGRLRWMEHGRKPVLSDREVTVYSEHIGDTFGLCQRGGQSAVAGVSQDGRAPSFRRPTARGREDGRAVP